MTTIRRQLRLWATAWLAFQVVSLSVLVPRDCCAAHRPAASSQPPRCHENTAARQCPMRAADGTPCPMHRGDHSHAEEKRGDTCSLRGTCGGPMAALATLLSNYGVVADSFTILPDLHSGSLTTATREHLIGCLPSPDPPPPRA